MRTISSKTKRQQYSISFVGRYEVTILTDQRIILPAGVIRQLKKHSVETVLLGKIPGLKALAFCPENLWDNWIKQLKNSFPCLRTHNGARSFLVPWQPIKWDTKGRLTLPRRARDYAGIKANEIAVVIGTDYRFELWSEKEFNDKLRECEAALLKSI